MTHKTGPRARVVERLRYDLTMIATTQSPRATAGEIIDALGHVMVDIMHTAMGPELADKRCPTCPKKVTKWRD